MEVKIWSSVCRLEFILEISRELFLCGESFLRGPHYFPGGTSTAKLAAPEKLSKIRYLDAQNPHLFLDS